MVMREDHEGSPDRCEILATRARVVACWPLIKALRFEDPAETAARYGLIAPPQFTSERDLELWQFASKPSAEVLRAVETVEPYELVYALCSLDRLPERPGVLTERAKTALRSDIAEAERSGDASAASRFRFQLKLALRAEEPESERVFHGVAGARIDMAAAQYFGPVAHKLREVDWTVREIVDLVRSGGWRGGLSPGGWRWPLCPETATLTSPYEGVRERHARHVGDDQAPAEIATVAALVGRVEKLLQRFEGGATREVWVRNESEEPARWSLNAADNSTHHYQLEPGQGCFVPEAYARATTNLTGDRVRVARGDLRRVR